MIDRARWELSLHESAHAVVVLAEGVELQGACLLRGNGGLAWHAECSGFQAALIAAAGLVSDAISNTIAMPETPAAPSPPEPLATAPATEPPSWMTKNQVPVVSDAACLALWTISGCLLEPERWSQRYSWLLGLAERILLDGKERWLTLAMQLYRDGFLLPPGARVVRDGEEK